MRLAGHTLLLVLATCTIVLSAPTPVPHARPHGRSLCHLEPCGDAAGCASWCSSYTCGSTQCSTCEACTNPGPVCAPWCKVEICARPATSPPLTTTATRAPLPCSRWRDVLQEIVRACDRRH